jgi:hypothetical protein
MQGTCLSPHVPQAIQDDWEFYGLTTCHGHMDGHHTHDRWL